MAQAPWYLQPTHLGANQTEFAPTGTGWNWGSAGPIGYTGNNRGDNEIMQVGGDSLVTVNGRQYLRTGSTDTTRFNQFNPQAGDIITDPRYGQLVSLELVERAGDEFNSGFWNGYGPVALAAAALGGVAAFGGAAGAAGAGAGELGAAAGAGELGAGAAAGGELGAGLGGGELIGAGETLGGEAAAGFDILDPATWGDLGGLTDMPPGVTSATDIGDWSDDPALLGEDYGDWSNDPALLGEDGKFDWSKLFGLGSGSILPSLIGGLGSYFGSKAQADSAEQANQMLWAMYQQNRADLEPWRTAGIGALGNLTHLTTPGEQVTAMEMDPGYQWRMDQGQQALDRAAASRGMFNSGRAGKELLRYGQGFASNEFGNIFNRNATLAGLGQTATNTGVQSGMNTANNMGNNTMAAGNAIGSGYAGIANALSGGLNNYALMDILRKNGGYG